MSIKKTVQQQCDRCGLVKEVDEELYNQRVAEKESKAPALAIFIDGEPVLLFDDLCDMCSDRCREDAKVMMTKPRPVKEKAEPAKAKPKTEAAAEKTPKKSSDKG